MNPRRFDSLVRSLVVPASRRHLLAGLLALLPALDAEAKRKRTAAQRKQRDKRRAKDKNKGKDKDRKRKQRRKRARAEAAPGCCSSGTCAPGKGLNLTKCCYEGQDLSGQSFKGSVLTNANFTGANLTNAEFKGANLTGACLVDADITGANFKGANLSGVIKCGTITGSGVDNSGCHLNTSCCPTCTSDAQCGAGERCCAGRCQVVECCGTGVQDTCEEGQVCCGATCVNTDTDPANCGACGARCDDPDPVCHGGQCVCGDVCAGGGCEFSTLADALASDLDPIRLCAGLFPTRVSITRDVTIIGAGAGENVNQDTILDGEQLGRVLTIAGGVEVTVRGLRIRNGRAPFGGGGIGNAGTLFLEGVTLIKNTSLSRGGAIFNAGVATLRDGTLITDNTADVSGGGVDNQGQMTLTDCTVTDNTATQATGGGLLCSGAAATLTLERTRVERNHAADGSGGGIHVILGALTLLAGTVVTGNTVFNTGGGVLATNPAGGTVPNAGTIDDNFIDDGITPPRENNCTPPGVVQNCIG